MIESDKQKFLEALTGCAVIYRVELKREQIKLYWAVLSDLSIDDFSMAIQRHMRQSKFFPTPAELLEYVPSVSSKKHVGADEAWALVVTSMDESETVVLTDEIMKARGVAWQLWDDGDRIGARMAFRSAYERIIAGAGEPVWRVIAGWDSSRLMPAVEQAKMLGRLPADYKANRNLLNADKPETTVHALLENLGKRVDLSEEEIKKSKRNIENIKAMLGANDDDGVERRQKEREARELHRQQELSRVAERTQGMH